MNIRAAENKARLAVAFFVVALFLIVALSLAMYSQARSELATQRIAQLKLETKLISLAISSAPQTPSPRELEHFLLKNGIAASLALFSPSGERLLSASNVDDRLTKTLPDQQALADSTAREASGGIVVRSEGRVDIAEVLIDPSDSRVLIVAKPAAEASPVIVYVVSYQIVAVVFGLGLLFVLVRWLLRPYRRMVEAARGSPIRPTGSISEGEFVAETFQALIKQLQANERELERLHEVERLRAEKSERFNERLIVNIPSGLVAIDTHGLVTSANAQALALFVNGARRQLVDESDFSRRRIGFRRLFEHAPRMIEMVDRCITHGESFRREEVDLTYSDGRVRRLGLSVSPITDSDQKLEGALCLMTDITEVMELRERMKLQENLANLGEMAAGLAHEFKNSLAAIHGYVQLVDSQAANNGNQRQKTIEAALNEVRLLARLVTDFLNFARPQHLSVAPVSLRDVIDAGAAEISEQLERAGIELRIQGNFPTLDGDDAMLRRAFVNLMRNAAEAIDPRSELRIIELTGSLEDRRGSRQAVVRIRDTGGGISPNDLQHIFIPFYTTKARGYGIGLAIVQKIIIAHGGKVSVEESNGNGTVFHCRLPLSQTEPSPEKSLHN